MVEQVRRAVWLHIKWVQEEAIQRKDRDESVARLRSNTSHTMVPEPINVPKGPKISNFKGGNEPPNKVEVNLEQWLYEVKSMLEMYPEVAVRGSIIWSLRGAAANSVRYLGEKSNCAANLRKVRIG